MDTTGSPGLLAGERDLQLVHAEAATRHRVESHEGKSITVTLAQQVVQRRRQRGVPRPAAVPECFIVVQCEHVGFVCPSAVADLQRPAGVVPSAPVPAADDPEMAVGPEQLQVVAPQVDRDTGPAQIERSLADPVPVQRERQHRHRVLGGVGAPAVLVGPDVPATVGASGGFPDGQDHQAATGPDATMVVVRAPAFLSHIET